MNHKLGKPAPAIIVGLWRKTARTWRAYMRRFALCWREAMATGHWADACHYLAQALNARDHWRRALDKAAKLERGDYTEAA